MKECPECERQYSIDRLICLDCVETLEDKTYLRFIWVTMAVAVIFHLWLQQWSELGRGLIREALKTEVFLLLISYPSWKVLQKLRNPKRRVLREMGSVFAERSDRLMVLGLSVFLLLSLPGLVSTLSSWELNLEPGRPLWLTWFLAVRLWVFLAALFVPIAVMIDQGWRFFDPRIQNTYSDREVMIDS